MQVFGQFFPSIIITWNSDRHLEDMYCKELCSNQWSEILLACLQSIEVNEGFKYTLNDLVFDCQ